MVLDRLRHANSTRLVKNRIAVAAYPRIYRLRARLPRYNLHDEAETFSRLAAERGLGDVRRYYWYHAVDLGGGLVTPGTHDYRRSLADFAFPADMSGMNALDVGSATGFFAFEFEQRGAHVVSVEVPSLEHVDHFPYEQATQTVKKIAAMTAGQSAYTSDEFEAVFDPPTRATSITTFSTARSSYVTRRSTRGSAAGTRRSTTSRRPTSESTASTSSSSATCSSTPCTRSARSPRWPRAAAEP